MGVPVSSYHFSWLQERVCVCRGNVKLPSIMDMMTSHTTEFQVIPRCATTTSRLLATLNYNERQDANALIITRLKNSHRSDIVMIIMPPIKKSLPPTISLVPAWHPYLLLPLWEVVGNGWAATNQLSRPHRWWLVWSLAEPFSGGHHATWLGLVAAAAV